MPTLAQLTGGRRRERFRAHCTLQHANRLGRIDPRERGPSQRGGRLCRAGQDSLRQYRRGRSASSRKVYAYILRRSQTRAQRRTVGTRCAEFVIAVRSQSSAEVLYGNAAAGGRVENFGGVLGVS